MTKVKMKVPENYAHKGIVLSEIGQVNTPQGEVIEVEDFHVDALNAQGFSIVEGVEPKTKEVGEDITTNTIPLGAEVTDSIDISVLNAEQLISLIKESGYPESEWVEITKKSNAQKKKLLLAYIDSKLKE